MRPLPVPGKTYKVIYDAKPWSLNQERTKHWTWTNQRTQEFKQAFWALALKSGQQVPRCHVVEITARILCKGKLMDPGNAYPAIKAAVDGLVLANVIPNDTPEHVKGIHLAAPEKSCTDALILEILVIK